jgi:hypothetical protein
VRGTTTTVLIAWTLLLVAGSLPPAHAQSTQPAERPAQRPGEPLELIDTPTGATAEPFGARGLQRLPDEPHSGTGSRAARILLFPARAAVQAGTFPVRTIGGALSSTGILQRMASGYEEDRYIVPVAGVDPTPGRNGGLRIGHGSPFDANGCVTYRLAFGGTKEQLFAVTMRSRDLDLTPLRAGWAYRVTAKYEIIPDKQFFGLGNLSRRADLTYYTRERYLFLATLRHAMSTWVRWDLTAALQRSQLSHAAYITGDESSIEDIFTSQATAPGFAINPQNIQGELALTLDRRDHRARPTRGWKAEGFFGYTRGTGADGVSFVRYGADLQGYLPLGERHVLALHAAGEEARTGQLEADGSARQIKLTELPSLGGRSTLRGYLSDRFMDNAALYWTGEYRYRLSHLIEASFFADFGRVMPRLLDFRFNELHRSFGAGLRFASDDEFYFTLQAARSDEDFVLTATLEPVFDRVDRRERR